MPQPQSINWSWLAAFDQRIQRRQNLLQEAREMLTVGTWFKVETTPGQWSRPFVVTHHKPRLILFADRDEQRRPPIQHRRLRWERIARYLDQMQILFLNPDGTLLE